MFKLIFRERSLFRDERKTQTWNLNFPKYTNHLLLWVLKEKEKEKSFAKIVQRYFILPIHEKSNESKIR